MGLSEDEDINIRSLDHMTLDEMDEIEIDITNEINLAYFRGGRNLISNLFPYEKSNYRRKWEQNSSGD